MGMVEPHSICKVNRRSIYLVAKIHELKSDGLLQAREIEDGKSVLPQDDPPAAMQDALHITGFRREDLLVYIDVLSKGTGMVLRCTRKAPENLLRGQQGCQAEVREARQGVTGHLCAPVAIDVPVIDAHAKG